MTGIVKRSFIAALVSIALAGGNSFAKNVLEPGEETQLHIPKMKAPTFDGKITEGEWGHAAALSGPADIHSGLVDSRPATAYLIP